MTDDLRRAVKAMTALLSAGEWAEHVSADPDAMALECDITKVIGASRPPQPEPDVRPVATIHADGYWTHPPGRDPLDRFAGTRSRMDVYADPTAQPAPDAVPVADELVKRLIFLRIVTDEVKLKQIRVLCAALCAAPIA